MDLININMCKVKNPNLQNISEPGLPNLCMCVQCFFLIFIEFSSKSVEIMGVPESHKKRLCWLADKYDCACLYDHPHCFKVRWFTAFSEVSNSLTVSNEILQNELL